MSDTGVQERASDAASTAKEQTSEVVQAATEQAKAVTADAKEQAHKLVRDVRQQVRDEAANQSSRFSESLGDLATQLQRMAGSQGAEGPAADVVRQAGDAIQRAASTLQSRRPEELLDEARRFARQRPGAFVLGALGAGFVAGRLLRAVDTSALKDAVRADGGEPDAVAGVGALESLRAAGSAELPWSDSGSTPVVP